MLKNLFGKFTINLGKADKLSQSASNMFTKAHQKLSKANELLEADRQEAIAHLEELQSQVRDAELAMEANKKVQSKLNDFIVG